MTDEVTLEERLAAIGLMWGANETFVRYAQTGPGGAVNTTQAVAFAEAFRHLGRLTDISSGVYETLSAPEGQRTGYAVKAFSEWAAAELIAAGGAVAVSALVGAGAGAILLPVIAAGVGV